MVILLSRNWWTLALRGVLAAALGIAAFTWPGPTLFAFTILFAAYAITDGVFALAAAIVGRPMGRLWWALLAEGLLGIAAGVLTLAWPGLTALAMVYLIAAWAIATGVMEIVAAINLRKEIKGEWLLALSGLLSVGFGLAMALWPASGALAMMWLIGAYAVGFGILMIVLAFRLRSWTHQVQAVALIERMA